MAWRSSIISPDSRVLVTGANGYIASHIIALLLDHGYRVRGTVQQSEPWLNEYFEKTYGPDRFETFLISGFNKPRSLRLAMEDISGVIHVATDLSSSLDTNTAITHAISSILCVLKTCSEVSSVKSVVLTSSSTAAYVPKAEAARVYHDTWNLETLHLLNLGSVPPERRSTMLYIAAKTEGERQAWKWVEENKPHFSFNTVLPSLTWGRILHPNILGSTMSWVTKLLEGDKSITNVVTKWFVDAEDVARLHLIALLSPKVQSERIFAFAGTFIWSHIIAILRQLRPDNKLIPEITIDERVSPDVIVPSLRAEKLLQEYFGRAGWTRLEDSLRRGVEEALQF